MDTNWFDCVGGMREKGKTAHPLSPQPYCSYRAIEELSISQQAGVQQLLLKVGAASIGEGNNLSLSAIYQMW